MPTVDEIAAMAFSAVDSAIPDAIHTATLNGATGRVVQEVNSGPSEFPAKSIRDDLLTVWCEGIAPVDGDTINYAGSDHLVIWAQDVMASGGMVKAKLFNLSGWMDTTVAFQRKERTSNGTGGFSLAWVAISGAPTACHMRALRGSERFASDRVEAVSGHLVIVEYFAGLTEADVLVVDGRRYNIRFIDNWEKKDKWFLIECDLGVAT